MHLAADPAGAQVEPGPHRYPIVAWPGKVQHKQPGAARIAVLFLHGWGVGPHSYNGPIDRLRRLGCDVYAPALPGFGGQAALPADDCSFSGYAAWVDDYLDAEGVSGPVVVVGHSFGGGVAVQFAHDHTDRVRAMVLCNGVGAFSLAALAPVPGAQHAPEAVPDGTGERPLWAWGRLLGADLLAVQTLTRVLPALLGDLVPNLVTNPLAMWRVGEFVRHADLVSETAAVAAAGVPFTMVWADRDRVVPRAGFSALCRAAGVEGTVVPGTHSWLIADPDRFADIVLRALVDAGVVESVLAAAV